MGPNNKFKSEIQSNYWKKNLEFNFYLHRKLIDVLI